MKVLEIIRRTWDPDKILTPHFLSAQVKRVSSLPLTKKIHHLGELMLPSLE